MERAEPDGVGRNEPGSHTAPVAATHDGDFGLVSNFIVWEVVVVWRGRFILRSFLGFHCWSHEGREVCERSAEARKLRRSWEWETKAKSEYKWRSESHGGGEAIHVSLETMRIMLNLGDFIYMFVLWYLCLVWGVPSWRGQGSSQFHIITKMLRILLQFSYKLM